jgi:N-acyl-D-aspartate/D-glutamate deacylase
MAFDLILRGGTVIDGSGAPGRRADVGVQAGRIVEVGDLAGQRAHRTIDAEGALVTPGFVDLHTHYDGQVTWDPDLQPSSVHGVTTAVLGSCGVGFAPCRAGDRDALIALMEGVEDIPGTALHEGIRWNWEHFTEYMGSLAGQSRSIDVGLHVPHDALRVFAMGQRGIDGEVANDDDLRAMQAELRAALEAGAMGFSTGRSDNHRSRSGAKTPAADASRHELATLASTLRGLDHGVLQAVFDYDISNGPDRFDAEFDLLEAMMAAAPGHRLSVSTMERDQDPGQWRRILARAEQAHARGLPIRLQVAPRGIGVILGFEATFHPFVGYPSYKAIAHLPLDERVAILRQPDFRAKLLAETSDRVAGAGSSAPPMADGLIAAIERIAFRMFRLGAVPHYEPAVTESIGAVAKARGVPVREALLDALLENDGRELLYFPVFNYAHFNLEAVREMLVHPLSLPGLSDGGAHVGTICDASFPTFLLTHWVRDRPTGRLPVERVVQMLSADTADHLGLRDRGRIAPGLRADLNVIDLAELQLGRPALHRDLPAGGQRLLQPVRGYRATLVAGHVISQQGALTGERPGQLLRAGQPPRAGR